MSKQLAEILNRLKSHLREIYGDRLVNMILFGSQARGEAAKDSDIDVLVVLKGNVNPGEEIKRTSLMVAELSLEYNQVISRLFMDESRFNSYNSPLLQNIRREGIAF
ncbi:MAG: nucleotidyltransferase domain-containing protein [Dolichospermum sp. JUN01]|nr:nucleotidyltransferase domain-containing protein [Dolichospermum sp. JUN01]MBS9392699.1 nucleotidyltransferase domain-containing protein [Dolichospermum sp. OL01]MCO5796336.1 nucleotidyltransferase domain-containing protein [Dolichospermum sp. OL03]MCS6279854.1 nucleotidyltransferase domain-containing protein [Dolichospermum sp.]QSV57952.1 MAG: nucleotidyltransferase domain-containing protein [Dolichospermum sp. LBC05a]